MPTKSNRIHPCRKSKSWIRFSLLVSAVLGMRCMDAEADNISILYADSALTVTASVVTINPNSRTTSGSSLETPGVFSLSDQFGNSENTGYSISSSDILLTPSSIVSGPQDDIAGTATDIDFTVNQAVNYQISGSLTFSTETPVPITGEIGADIAREGLQFAGGYNSQESSSSIPTTITVQPSYGPLSGTLQPGTYSFQAYETLVGNAAATGTGSLEVAFSPTVAGPSTPLPRSAAGGITLLSSLLLASIVRSKCRTA